MSNQFYWLILIIISILSLFYFNFILFLITLIILSIIAIILALLVNSRDLKLINYFKNNQLYELDNEINLISKDDFLSFFNSLSSKTSPIQQLLNRKQNSYQQKFNNLNDDKTNELFTGDSRIDEQINDLINLILRDYIFNWYTNLSSNQEFVNELKSIIQTIIRILAIKISKIDKINYITKNLTNNFVNHLKLYRLSKHYLKSNNLELNDDNLKKSFFNFELQSESNKFSRNAVSENNEFTIKYLTELINILEYLILPPDLFNNRTIKYLVNNLLINSTFCPLFNLLSDSDFINQSLISFCKSRKLNISLSESFLIILRSCSSKDELNAVLEKVREETASKRSQDCGGEKDFEIKQQLSSLNYVNSVIKERLKLLNEGSLDKANQEENNNFNSQKNDLVSLTFDFVLTNPLALTYFFEYMITINKQSYLNFYLSVEGFRLSIEQKLVSIQMKESEELIKRNDLEFKDQDTDEDEIDENSNKNDLTEKEIVELNNELKNELNDEQKSVKNNNCDKLIKKLENRMRNKLRKLKEDNEKAEWLSQIENRAREEARNIYDTYLSSNSSSKHRITIDDTLIQDLKRKIEYDELSETWFDSIHSLVYRRLREEEPFFNSFKKSIHYYKLLKELGLLKRNNLKDKNLLNQLNNKTNSTNHNTQQQQSNKNVNILIDVDNTSMKSNHSNDTESLNSLLNDNNKIKLNEKQDSNQDKEEIIELNDKSIIQLDADITSTGITKEFGKEYGVYIIDISRKDYQNEQTDKFKENNWCVIRRYSDFYTFHQLTIKLFPQLNKFNLPSKKVFSNMNQEFLEQRKQSLNLYLKNLLTFLNNNANQDKQQFNLDKFKLREHILQFFESGNYVPKPIKSTTNNQILTKTMNSVFNPFKSISSKSKSGNLIEGISKIKPFGSNNSNSSSTTNNNQNDKQKLQINELKPSFSSSSLSNLQINQQQSSNLSPKIQSNHHSNQTNSTNFNENNDLISAKLNSTNGIYLESETNIPLRILLLLMDEIFDLKSKSFWLRRRIFNVIVKQIIQTTYGNTINLISWINRLFSPASIESYIKTIKKTLFPNGYRAIPTPERDKETKLRTKIATKMLLLSIIPDDLLSIIGSETSRKSVIGLFNMLQNETLNRRLVIVIFETFLIQLFPDNQLDKVFERLHSIGTKHKDKIDNTDLVWPPYLMNINSNISSNSNSDQSSKKTSPIFRYQS